MPDLTIVDEDNIGPDDADLPLQTFHVEVTAPNSHTYEVQARTQAEAQNRYSEGLIVNSETGSPEVVSVVQIAT